METRLDSRFLIDLPILEIILESSVHFCHTNYDSCLFQTMCSLAFFACLRVGETSLAQTKSRALIINRVVSLKFTFPESNHNCNQRLVSLVINRRYRSCPAQIILNYLSVGGCQPGPLFFSFFFFFLFNKSTVSRVNFINKLSIDIKYCVLDASRYRGLCFRIGAASYAANAQIRALGRWEYNAFLKYIQMPFLIIIVILSQV